MCPLANYDAWLQLVTAGSEGMVGGKTFWKTCLQKAGIELQGFGNAIELSENVRIIDHLTVLGSACVAHISHQLGTDIGSSWLHGNSIGVARRSFTSHIRYL